MAFLRAESLLILVAAVAVLLCIPPVLADDMSGLPTLQQESGITFITGGIGDEERDALKAVEHDYNLHVMSAGTSGAFTGDTIIAIRTRRGEELLSTDAGPIFYASLPPGHYVVEATSDGQTRKQDITIARGTTSHVHFSWK